MDEQVARTIEEYAEHNGNAGFHYTFERSSALFAPFLRSPDEESTDDSPGAVESGENVTATDEVDMTDSAATRGAAVDPSDGEAVWGHVEARPSVEASKSVDIRVSIVELLGKTAAKKLLFQTKATVAKNANGYTNRVVRFGEPH